MSTKCSIVCGNAFHVWTDTLDPDPQPIRVLFEFVRDVDVDHVESKGFSNVEFSMSPDAWSQFVREIAESTRSDRAGGEE